MAPKMLNPAFWKMLVSGKVEDQFSFKFTRHTTLGYLGMATRMPTDDQWAVGSRQQAVGSRQ
jgi:hypothetical protein